MIGSDIFRIMNAQTIENILNKLGRQDFTRAGALILRSFFGLNAIMVDGANDAGSDWWVFKDSGGPSSAAFSLEI
jgi:hypothetical protein